jgi:16S rRNA (cytosine967-C5)-methyltransferase
MNARDVAFEVVRDVFGPELRGAQASFDTRARRAGLDARDRAFAAELAYGSIKQRRLIDWYLKPYVGGREKPLPPAILEVLRLGVYQLRFMSGTGDHAAVSETVNLAWRHGHKGTAGLVNAVLRRMIADGPLEPDATDFASDNDYAGVRYSVPTWVAAQFGRSYDGERDAALAGVNSAPQHALRVNTLRAETATIAAELAERGVATRPSPFVGETLLLDTGSLGDDPGGRWSIQGEAAAMPVDVLAPQPGETVLEFCGGLGNKTLQLAARTGGLGSIVSVEQDEKKIRVMREQLERSGVENVAVVHGDARYAAEEVRAGAVLLDAPCSGLGVIGRHPEARWRKTPDDGARLSAAQDELLRAAAIRTAPGGRLVYSVCSSDPREGSERIDAFLAEDLAFSRSPLPERYAPFAREGDLIVPAGIEGRDGFYIASLVRS